MKFARWFIVILLFLTILPLSVMAQNNSLNTGDLENKIKEYQNKLNDLHQQKNTLSSQIQYMDTQIYLTELKIEETENKIAATQKEIDLLTTKIEGLDNSLNYLSQMLIKRIVTGYKTRQASFLSILLDSNNANELLNRIKYYKTTQDNNQKTLIQVQETKLNFEEQKKLREEKKVELDQLTQTLENQKSALNSQKSQKQKLLADTQNDEATYQQLLENAQKQLASFRSFVQSAGGGIIAANGFGQGSDGWYYSQRDERWATKTIGYSGETILNVGCLITDIAMMMKKNGSNWTPLDIASNPDYFFSNTAYMLYPSRFSWPIGLNYVNIDIGSIPDEVKNGHPVIAGLYAGAYGTHYITIKTVDNDDYIIHDPYYGPDKKFSEYYSRSAIFVAGVFK